jgi:hypothetical protein
MLKWKNPSLRLAIFMGLGTTFGLGLGTGFAVDRLAWHPAREDRADEQARSIASDEAIPNGPTPASENACVVLRDVPLSDLRREIGRRTRYKGPTDWFAERFAQEGQSPAAPAEAARVDRARALLQGNQAARRYWRADIALDDGHGRATQGTIYLNLLEDAPNSSNGSPRFRIYNEFQCRRPGQAVPASEGSVRMIDDNLLAEAVLDTGPLRDRYPAALLSLPTSYSEELHVELFDLDRNHWAPVSQVFFWLPMNESEAEGLAAKTCP